MSQYSLTESGKFGARIYNKGAFIRKPMVPQQVKPEKEKPILINPETKTWMVWDKLQQDYIDSNVSILKNDTTNGSESK